MSFFSNPNEWEAGTISTNHNKILAELLAFVETKEKKKLSDANQNEVFKNFNHFMSDMNF